MGWNLVHSDDANPVTAFFHLEVTRMMLLSGVTLLLYDHALTFADEMRLIWRAKRFGLISTLFLLVRHARLVVSR